MSDHANTASPRIEALGQRRASIEAAQSNAIRLGRQAAGNDEAGTAIELMLAAVETAHLSERARRLLALTATRFHAEAVRCRDAGEAQMGRAALLERHLLAAATSGQLIGAES